MEGRIYHRSTSAYCEDDEISDFYEVYVPDLGIAINQKEVVAIVTEWSVSKRYRPMEGHPNWDKGFGAELLKIITLTKEQENALIAADEARAAKAKPVHHDSHTAAQQRAEHAKMKKSQEAYEVARTAAYSLFKTQISNAKI